MTLGLGFGKENMSQPVQIFLAQISSGRGGLFPAGARLACWNEQDALVSWGALFGFSVNCRRCYYQHG